MSGTAVFDNRHSAQFSAQLDRFDALIDAPEPFLPVGGLWLCRIRGLLLLVAAVAQAWLLHGVRLVRQRLARRRPDAGMTTAEYAVGTVAACGFAALLYKVVTSGAVSSALNALVTRALHVV
ncbi:DUF4244 domain-containing protein [Streptacidiphilus cavernicola]|uniref:DUF4244 domain-containing protein n=1 Tax=Streptacidiphilus cavernicola TaxID=3342716 RepID=A0ABV6VWN0_9ACTN